MAHFARVEDGIVREVIVVNNEELDDNGTESEAKGIAFCHSLFGDDSVWVQTSYNGNPINGEDRGPYAAIGFTWDGQRFQPSVNVAASEEPAP